MIDWPFVQAVYNKILEETSVSEDIKNWSITPQKISLTDHKTKYGMADIDGVVYVNQAFINSNAVHLLTATIRHELAHLCVGLQHGHNAKFKAKAKQFKANFSQILKTEYEQVHEAIGYKYRLYAYLENKHDGKHEKILFKRVHRKHAKYLNYQPGRFRYLIIKGQKVMSFQYVR